MDQALPQHWASETREGTLRYPISIGWQLELSTFDIASADEVGAHLTIWVSIGKWIWANC